MIVSVSASLSMSLASSAITNGVSSSVETDTSLATGASLMFSTLKVTVAILDSAPCGSRAR